MYKNRIDLVSRYLGEIDLKIEIKNNLTSKKILVVVTSLLSLYNHLLFLQLFDLVRE